MAENYVVNYDINVRSQQALAALRNFQQATTSLTECGKQLTAFQRKIDSVTAKFSAMTKKTPILGINTQTTEKKLDRVIVKLERIHALSKQASVLNSAHPCSPIYCHEKDDRNSYRFIVGNLICNKLCTIREFHESTGEARKNIERYAQTFRDKGAEYFFLARRLAASVTR